MRILFLILLLSLSFNVWALDLTSLSFRDGDYIPSRYTCDSLDISPAFIWKDVPPGTQSFVFICDDVDAPAGDWVHWVIFNIPAKTRKLKERVSKVPRLTDGTIQVFNDFGKIGYNGPCPPFGKVHHYSFTLYAVDKTLALNENATKKDILNALNGHILSEANIVGIYKR